MMIHVTLSLVLIGLGAILLLPSNTFGTTPAWSKFAEVGSETTWGIIFILVGGAGSLGIDTSRHWLKVASVLILATAHGTLSTMFLRGNPVGGASWTFAMIAVQGYYLVWRLIYAGMSE